MEIATMTPQEFGERIRTHRETQGLTVEDAAARLKLSKSTIRAIEAGRVEDMPHAVYAKGFVRSYAQTLRLSDEDLQSGLAALFPDTAFDDVPVTPGPASVKPIKAAGRSNFGGFLVFLLVLGCLGGAGWYVFSNFDSVKEIVMRPLSAITSGSNAPSREEPSPSAQGRENAVPPAANVDSAPSAPVVEPPAPLVESPAALPAVEPDRTPTAQTALPPTGTSLAEPQPAPVLSVAETAAVTGKQITVKAMEECWVQVFVDGGGSRMFTMQAGETSLLPYKNRMTVVLGNAGGVTLSHNGKAYALNGKRNEKKTITFQ